MIQDVLAGIGGALKGGFEGYSYMREAAQKDKQIANQEQIAQMRAEVQQMIAELNAKSHEKVAGMNNTSKETIAGGNNRTRENVAGLSEFGKNFRWGTPSGNVTAQQEGANSRTDVVAGVTERGQDIGAGTTRRGQDMTAGTAKRWQDLNYTLGGERNAVTQRGQDMTAGTAAAGQAAATARAKLRPQPFSFDAAAPAVGDATGTPPPDITPPVVVPAPAPPVAVPHAPLQVTPRRSSVVAPGRAPMPDPAAGVQDPATQLALQATDLLVKSRAEKDPVKKSAYQAELARLRDQILAMRKGAQ